jgi:hypothetical protein
LTDRLRHLSTSESKTTIEDPAGAAKASCKDGSNKRVQCWQDLGEPDHRS